MLHHLFISILVAQFIVTKVDQLLRRRAQPLPLGAVPEAIATKEFVVPTSISNIASRNCLHGSIFSDKEVPSATGEIQYYLTDLSSRDSATAGEEVSAAATVRCSSSEDHESSITHQLPSEVSQLDNTMPVHGNKLTLPWKNLTPLPPIPSLSKGPQETNITSQNKLPPPTPLTMSPSSSVSSNSIVVILAPLVAQQRAPKHL